MSKRIPSGNPNPSRRMLAFHFLQALVRIRRTAHHSRCKIAQRSRRIKRAAYVTMALAAGPRRAWSRAILCHLHGRRRRTCRVQSLSGKRVLARCKRARDTRTKNQTREGNDQTQVSVLRRLVPGGGSMTLCSLLEETESYIQYLACQIQLMKNIADSISE